jgi:uncharacterized membrane protein
MKAKTVFIWVIILAVGALVFGLALEPRFADQIAIHWDGQGVADGFGSRFMGLYFMPIIIVGMSLLLLGIPQIDPLKKNIEKFRKEYYYFILIFAVYFVYIHVLTILYNVGMKFNMLVMMIPPMAGLFYYLGVMMSKAKQNYFIGIRTPWTLQDEDVWNETHAVGSKGFKLAAILSLIGVVFPSLAIWFLMIPLVVVAIYTVGYSFVAYRRRHGNNGNT